MDEAGFAVFNRQEYNMFLNDSNFPFTKEQLDEAEKTGYVGRYFGINFYMSTWIKENEFCIKDSKNENRIKI